MPMAAVGTGQIQCSMALVPAPLPLTVVPASMVMVEGKPAATIMDNAPMMNIPSFGMCNSPVNPQVIALTAAALGVHTPAPCIPATSAPWTPGQPTVMIGKKPALDQSSTCLCLWTGMISFAMPGAVKTQYG